MATSWQRLIQAYSGRDVESAEIRARLVQWVTMLTPCLLVVNVVAAVLQAALLPAPLPPWQRWAWCAVVCQKWVPAAIAWWLLRDSAPRARPSPSSGRRSGRAAAPRGIGGVQGFRIARPMAIDPVCAMLEGWHLHHAPRPDSVPDSIFAPLGDAASA